MRNLFRPPSETLRHDLEKAMQAIRVALPLSGTHEKELPFAVRDLSRLLTQDRADLRQSYWINKRLLAAYCRYFLPWNLLRLSWLLPGMDIGVKPGDAILDLGSGPLTLPIALWLAKPEWRDMPLVVVCSDVAPAPLNAGRDVFRALVGDSPWKIELRRGPLEKTLREFSGRARLITAANVLNEFKPTRETSLEERLFSIIRGVSARLAPDGQFLAVEPGTRLGGKLLALLRRTAFAAKMAPESPCPHWGACPMLDPTATSWCHFSHTAEAAPKGLVALASRAKLDKDSLSLSCMLLRKTTAAEQKRAASFIPEECEDDFWEDDNGNDHDEAPRDASVDAWAEAFAAMQADAEEKHSFVRVISDPIRLPDEAEPARYCCSAKGLVLAKNALRMPSGAAVAVKWHEQESRDPKTNALITTFPRQSRAPSSERHKPESGKPEPRKFEHRKPEQRAARDAAPYRAPPRRERAKPSEEPKRHAPKRRPKDEP